MLRRLVSLIGVLLLAFVALPAAAQSNTGGVRVVHASPDAGEVDVFVDGAAVLEGVAFADISNYLDVPAGEHTFAVAPAGQGVDAAVIEATATIEADQGYTVAAIGTVANNNLRAQIFTDNLSAPAAGKAHVRVLHLSPDAPAVDVKTADDAVTLVSNLSYPNASDYVPVDARSYDLKVTQAGATEAVLELQADLEAGTIYDVFAVGLLGSDDDATALQVVVDAYEVSGTLPDTGMREMPLIVLAGVAAVALAGGLALRRRWA